MNPNQEVYERLLSRLARVHRGANGQDSACCPAHSDRSPSLGTTLLTDGRILIICRAGCAPADIVSAVGMELADLMPPRPRDTPDGPGGYASLPWYARVKRTDLFHEAMVLATFIERVQTAQDYWLEDLDRAELAADRLVVWIGVPEGHDQENEHAAMVVGQRFGEANRGLQ